MVALRKESVDRNYLSLNTQQRHLPVALRKESVDRNSVLPINVMSVSASLSARRAWIEIAVQELIPLVDSVALRKESVDRNGLGFCDRRDDVPSLSARRAWIEMPGKIPQREPFPQSLSARRAWIEIPRPSIAGYLLNGRSPQGERG